jgi:hypothetical protein
VRACALYRQARNQPHRTHYHYSPLSPDGKEKAYFQTNYEEKQRNSKRKRRDLKNCEQNHHQIGDLELRTLLR